jgi:hypothetical protein
MPKSSYKAWPTSTALWVMRRMQSLNHQPAQDGGRAGTLRRGFGSWNRHIQAASLSVRFQIIRRNWRGLKKAGNTSNNTSHNQTNIHGRAKAYVCHIRFIATNKAQIFLMLAIQQSGQTPPRSFSVITSGSADDQYSATLAQFVFFFERWTPKPRQRLSVQQLLIAALTDDAPQRSQVSTVEAFLLWIAKGCRSPDDFQHRCVHVKYALRGAALIHCAENVSPTRQASWCRKWLSSTALGCVSWTAVEQEKKVAAFFARIAPKPSNVSWPTPGAWDPVSSPTLLVQFRANTGHRWRFIQEVGAGSRLLAHKFKTCCVIVIQSS